MKGYKKEFSTNCKICGVEWDETWSNKQPKRAVCKTCFSEIVKENDKKYKQGRTLQDRIAVNAPLKVSVRKPHWDKISAELKLCKKREEWLPIIQRNLTTALNDEIIKQFLNSDYITEETKLKDE